ncbi:hypothetical protein E4U41_007077 [Claviceps citrina]|nr:hypothetical protein E4U41_007077 [Claviceps citrina]
MNTLVTLRPAAKRSFSLLTTATRAVESHPLQRLSGQESARPDWRGEGKRLGKQAALFVPSFAVLLGWPFLAKTVFDGHV